MVSDSIDLFNEQKGRSEILKGEINTLRLKLQNQLLTPCLTEASKILGHEFLSSLNSFEGTLNNTDDLIEAHLNVAKTRQESLQKIKKELRKFSFLAKKSSSDLIEQANEIKENMIHAKNSMLDPIDLQNSAEAGLVLVSRHLDKIKSNSDRLGNINLFD